MQVYKNTLRNKLRNGIALSIIPQIFLVSWLSGRPDIVEKFYSNSIYPFISTFFRTLFGWVPFSVGELLYTFLIILGIRYLIKKHKKIKANKLAFLRDIIMVLSVFYFTFHLVWGLNYYRHPISKTLDIEEKATFSEIRALAAALVIRTNQLQEHITGDSTKMVKTPYSKNEIFEKTITQYDRIANYDEYTIHFLKYQKPNLKKSTYSTISSYMGIGGYLNPFTNEAQVNSKTPLFRLPVVVAHEIGHQVGYSAENDTNLIGYLVTAENPDIYFRYSANAYALSYCLNALHRTDKDEFNRIFAGLNLGVKKNYQELQDFNDTYKNPFEPIFKSIFSSFLKANNQADGIKSYSRVVNLLVGYHKKHPL